MFTSIHHIYFRLLRQITAFVTRFPGCGREGVAAPIQVWRHEEEMKSKCSPSRREPCSYLQMFADNSTGDVVKFSGFTVAYSRETDAASRKGEKRKKKEVQSG